MNKTLVTKAIKGFIIGGVAYSVADLCYQFGKGSTLGYMLNRDCTAKEEYDFISKLKDDSSLSPLCKLRLGIVKGTADLMTRK